MDVTEAQEIYLDNNATTQALPEVQEAMLEVLGAHFGNPSSAHSSGDRARAYLTESREAVASLIGAETSQIVFTGSGTEANNMVLASAMREDTKKARIITTSVEHSSIAVMVDDLGRSNIEFIQLQVDRGGMVSVSDLAASISPETALVSIQWVNNETGVIQLIEEIGMMCRDQGVPFHTDAAQAVGKLPVDVTHLPVDYLSLTAHKFHGPQGIGALYVRDPTRIAPMFYGGAQENSLRPGTENMSGIAGLGKAAALRQGRFDQVQMQLTTLRNYIERCILDLVPDVDINGDRNRRVCNTTNLLFRDVDGQALVAQLDQAGIRSSQSSACTNQRPEPSYVLQAMGLSEQEAYASVRFSVSELNTMEEMEEAAGKIADICERLRMFNTRRNRMAQLAEVH